VKGYKRFLRIDCVERNDGSKIYFGRVILSFWKEKLYLRDDSLCFWEGSQTIYLSFVDCKIRLRDQFGILIKELKEIRNKQWKKRYKFWP